MTDRTKKFPEKFPEKLYVVVNREGDEDFIEASDNPLELAWVNTTSTVATYKLVGLGEVTNRTTHTEENV